MRRRGSKKGYLSGIWKAKRARRKELERLDSIEALGIRAAKKNRRNRNPSKWGECSPGGTGAWPWLFLSAIPQRLCFP